MKTSFIVPIAAAGAIAFLAGCASRPISSYSAAEVSDAATIHRDDFRKITSVDGQFVKLDPLAENSFKLAVSGFDGADEGISYALVFVSNRSPRSGWAFWREAVDQDGNVFRPVGMPSREVGYAGRTSEIISFPLRRDYLESKRQSGVNVRIDGQRAKKELTVPANYIDGFLRRVDATFGTGRPDLLELAGP